MKRHTLADFMGLASYVRNYLSKCLQIGGGVSKDEIPSPVLAQSLSLSFSAQRLSPIQCLETKSKDLRFWKHRKLCQCIVNGSIRAKNAFLAGGCMKAYSTLSQLQCSETKSKHLKVGKHWNFANGFSMLQFVQKTQSAQGGCVKVYPTLSQLQLLRD